MRVSLLLCVLALLAGCRSLPRAAEGPGFSLTPEEQAFAEALGHYARGLISEAEGSREAPLALDEFLKAVRSDPGRMRLHSKAAAAALYARQPAKAIETLEELCSLSPTSVVARTDLASVYQFTGDLRKAEKTYAEALLLDRTRSDTYWDVARLLFARGADEEACRLLADGLRHAAEPASLVQCANAQAVDFVRSRQLPRAIRCYEMLAANWKPQQREFLNLLGDMYNVQGNREGAMRSFEAAVAFEPPLPLSFVKLASLQFVVSPDEAIRTLQKGAERFPNETTLLFMLAYSCMRQGRFDTSLQVFERMKTAVTGGDEKAPVSAEFYVLYANACELAGRREQAEALMAECLKLHPDAHEALNYLAYTWAERGEKLGEAYEYVQRALTYEPANAAYLDTLGWIYYKQREYRKALEEIGKASELLADDATIADHLGDVHNALGDAEQAVVHWKRSFSLNPNEGNVAGKLQNRGVDVESLRKTIPPPDPQPAQP